MKPTQLGVAVVLAGMFAACGENAAKVQDGPGDFSERGGIGVQSSSATSLTADQLVIDPRRSLAVTDFALTQQFTLDAVLNQLAAQSPVRGSTGLQLFRQLWDTQNTAAAAQTGGSHCDDNTGTVNGFPYSCRPLEGAMASQTTTSNFSIVGVYNRFDLASPDGSDCGEYRMVFAKTSGGGRAFIIFEGVLPNANRADGVQGCLPVSQFWASLTSINDPTQRAASLRSFFFTGLQNFGPVISIANYGLSGAPRSGQVRINQFVSSPWQLKEFKLNVSKVSGLVFKPVSVKVNPFKDLFRDGSADPRAADFQQFFLTQVATLARNDINTFDLTVTDRFNAAESTADASSNLFTQAFSPSGAFASALQAELKRLGSTLTPSNLVERAQALSCAGCHEESNGHTLGGGLSAPFSTRFVHSSETPETGPDGPRFTISHGLTTVFLPNRSRILREHLTRPRCSPGATRCDPQCTKGGGPPTDTCIVQCSGDGSAWLPSSDCGPAASHVCVNVTTTSALCR